MPLPLPLLKEKKVVDVSHWMSEPSICANRQMEKSCKLPFNYLNKISEFPCEKIHCDLYGSCLSSHTINFSFIWFLLMIIQDQHGYISYKENLISSVFLKMFRDQQRISLITKLKFFIVMEEEISTIMTFLHIWDFLEFSNKFLAPRHSRTE